MNRSILGVITIINNYGICSNFPNYLIYDNGDIFSIKNRKFLVKNKTLNKYEFIVLVNGSNKIMFYVHRLIYLVFKGDILPNCEINHINHIRDCNNINNLECISIQENRRKRRPRGNNNYYLEDNNNNSKYREYYKSYYNNHKNS